MEDWTRSTDRVVNQSTLISENGTAFPTLQWDHVKRFEEEAV